MPNVLTALWQTPLLTSLTRIHAWIGRSARGAAESEGPFSPRVGWRSRTRWDNHTEPLAVRHSILFAATMKTKSVVYWTTTALTAASMAFSAELYLARNAKMMVQFKKLDYPGYFPTILGACKLLGVAALLAPRRALLKEWAYAGFSFTFLGASASHLAKRQGKEALAPLVSLAILAVSYLTRPEQRRAADSPHA